MSAICRGRRALTIALLLPALVAPTGCATVMAVSNTAVLVNALPSRTPHWVETNRITIGYAPSDVYAMVEQEVERDGRRIVERNAASGVLVVSYPFSLWQNNWGGMIRFSCVADEAGTTLTVHGDGRDVVPHVRAIGNQVLDDLARALRRRPRTLQANCRSIDCALACCPGSRSHSMRPTHCGYSTRQSRKRLNMLCNWSHSDVTDASWQRVTNMKTDATLKSDIERELAWDPSINATHIGVMVEDGVVTVTGHLDSYAQKDAVERAVARVQNVRAVAVELDVKLAPGHVRSDSEIAHAAETALQWLAHVPADRIRLKVEKGWIWLDGELDWDFQRQAAINAVRNMTGVMGLTSYMTLKPMAVPSDVRQRIHDALARHADREARHVEIHVEGSVARLRGRVETLAARNAVQGAAWSAPGISSVVNELQVSGAN